MTGGNPYVTPKSLSAGVPDAPESFGWELVGKRVWAEKFGQFPMVDPYSGESEEVMTLNRLAIRLQPWWLTIIRWICIGAVLSLPTPWISLGLRDSLVSVGIVGFLISKIAELFFPLCGLKVFFTRRTLRTRAILKWGISGCFVVMLFGGMTVGNSRVFPVTHPRDWIPGIAFSALIVGLIWQWFFMRRLRCRRRKEGRFEILGFHPRALAMLAQEPVLLTRPKPGAPPVHT